MPCRQSRRRLRVRGPRRQIARCVVFEDAADSGEVVVTCRGDSDASYIKSGAPPNHERTGSRVTGSSRRDDAMCAGMNTARKQGTRWEWEWDGAVEGRAEGDPASGRGGTRWEMGVLETGRSTRLLKGETSGCESGRERLNTATLARERLQQCLAVRLVCRYLPKADGARPQWDAPGLARPSIDC